MFWRLWASGVLDQSTFLTEQLELHEMLPRAGRINAAGESRTMIRTGHPPWDGEAFTISYQIQKLQSAIANRSKNTKFAPEQGVNWVCNRYNGLVAGIIG